MPTNHGASERARVELITIQGLFRQYTHKIRLRHEDRVTILHGRNGVGKTVTLGLVADLLRGNYTSLLRFPFSTLRVDFSDKSFIQIVPVPQRDEKLPQSPRSSNRGRRRSQSKLFGKDIDGLQLEFLSAETQKPDKFLISRASLAQAISKQAPWLAVVDDGHWLDRRIDDILTTDEVLVRYADMAMSPTKLYEEPETLLNLRKRISVHLIEAQRLFEIKTQKARSYRDESPSVSSAVTTIAQQMAARIQTVDSTYRATSTRLDDSLPTRLFTANVVEMPADELKLRTEALEQERKRLRGIGLIDIAVKPFNPAALNNTQRAMFAVYLKDNEEKLEVFKELADRAEILLNIINHKFYPKKILLDKDVGYKAFSHDDRELALDRLSSGEQHELVLLHNLLFRVSPGALLLIDEPELSLHVTWQNEFLEDLIQIARKVEFDAVVATHSPYIVGSRRDLMEQLGEPV